jgi:malic enzyme
MFVDSCGIVWDGRTDLEVHKREVALTPADFAALRMTLPPVNGLEQIVHAYKPAILIGTTGQPGDFTPAVIRAMAAVAERPMILPLSNPTSKAECTPSEALQYSNGRALVATGSPFDPVTFQGKQHVIGQCNNVFVFPGIGLGAVISEATRVTDSMFLAAAQALAEFTRANPCAETSLYPSVKHLRDASRIIAFKVGQTARDEGVGRTFTDAALRRAIEDFCWFPEYESEPLDEAAVAVVRDRAVAPNGGDGRTASKRREAKDHP